MKKIKLPEWISFIVILIIASCNSAEKSPDNPINKDTVVVPKKVTQTTGWTTNSALIMGTIEVSLSVNGTKVITDSGKITIRPASDFSAIEINCPQGKLILSPGWHGMGDYDKVFAEWTDMAERMPIRFTSESSAPGNVKITEWGDGKVAGTFSATVIENNALQTPGKKLLEGEFKYLHDR